MTKIIPSTDRVLDAQHDLNAQPRAVLRLPRVVIEEKRDPVTGEVQMWNGRPVLKGRQQTIDEWQAENDPERQQARLMNDVRNPEDA